MEENIAKWALLAVGLIFMNFEFYTNEISISTEGLLWQ